MNTSRLFFSSFAAAVFALTGVAHAGTTTIEDSRSKVVAPDSVACAFSSSNGLSQDMHFALADGKESTVAVAGNTSALFKLEVEPTSGENPGALVTVRGEMNYLRFLDARQTFVSRQNGLDGFGTKALTRINELVYFQLTASTGKPGLITVGCKLEVAAHPVAVTARADVPEDAMYVSFSGTDQ